MDAPARSTASTDASPRNRRLSNFVMGQAAGLFRLGDSFTGSLAFTNYTQR